jgi:predicted Rossmann-fold nucleotide-binding protein
MSYHYPHHVGKIFPQRRTASERVADLVSRYPGVTDEEAKEILTFMRTGRHLEVGLLTANDNIRPNLDAFMEDHKAHFQVKWWEGAAVTTGIAALLVLFWLGWEALA